jgi:hypothetical protein
VGTMIVSLGSATNGVLIEVLGPSIGCGYLGRGDYPTPDPFTLVLSDAPGGSVTVSSRPGVGGAARPLPSNDLRCPGG